MGCRKREVRRGIRCGRREGDVGRWQDVSEF